MGSQSKTPFRDYLERTKEVGYVERIMQSVVEVVGLPGLRLGEAIVFDSGQVGMTIFLGKDYSEVLVLASESVRVGSQVARTGYQFSVPASEAMLGRTVNSLGRAIQGPALPEDRDGWQIVERTPYGISQRRRINRQLETGVVMMDMLVPLGMGQRELVIGDRKTGKSTLLLQAILNQARKGTVCVYAAIGKKMTDIVRIEEFLMQADVKEKAVLVATSSRDSAGEIFLCPFTAMTIAEYFRDKGRDVLVVMDDMTAHSEFYRELSLLMHKFPGRESYPGDIFHTHSKLLERAGNFAVKLPEGEKEVSITCLPVVESVQGEMAGYIQTNIMSMTDGHVYFDYELYFKGRRPAINPFVSVTRVGRQTQTVLQRNVQQYLLNMLNSYEKTQGFLKFGAELGENSRQVLAVGERVLAYFNQPQFCMVPTNLQLALLGLLLSGLWNGQFLEKAVSLYTGDAAFEGIVDQTVEGCMTVEDLMAKTRGQAQLFSQALS
jgi:F-type H+-transporting ATPase subunit alpha